MNYTKEQLQQAVAESKTITNVLKLLGYPINQGVYHRKIKASCLEFAIDTSHFTRKGGGSGGIGRPLNEILIENSPYPWTATLKARLIKHGLLEYKCVHCNNTGEWLGQTLSLQLDHINGINTDNRLENLRLLCPNCHSQTDTFGGRKLRKQRFCTLCKTTEIQIGKVVCEPCKIIKRNSTRKFEVSKEELQTLINNNPIKGVGRIFGVSDNSIRKRCDLLGVEYLKEDIPPVYCMDCNIPITHGHNRCKPCFSKSKEQLNISKEELENMFKKFNLTTIAKKLGFSRDTIKTKCKKYGIAWRKWSRTSDLN